jgi:anhydro-N-acetylmuramic acid kinase
MEPAPRLCYKFPMPKNSMIVMGLMSGTSADGIEVALAQISGASPRIKIRLIGHVSVDMDKAVRAEILRVAEGIKVSAGEISQLNFRLGEVFAEAALTACKKLRVPLRKLDLIGSHGQTIFHQGKAVPFLHEPTRSTLQIAEPAVIAARTGITTIGDFRVADMATGGQGAPLVPFADWILYSHPKISRASLNLGGIANITVMPAGAGATKVFAFDTGPANMLIDALVSHFTKGRKRFDRNAQIAMRGNCISSLLSELLQDPYLRLSPPKSSGREYFGRDFLAKLLAKGRTLRATPEDLVRTATAFTALSVVDALNRFVFPKTKIQEIIVSGGGTHNPVLMAQLEAALSPIKVMPSSQLGVPEDAKEALAFALIAYETWHRRPGNIPSATGARKPAILGKICYA